MDQVLYSRKEFGTVMKNLSQQGQRFHRDLMSITIEEPDRKGARKVRIDTEGAQAQFNLAEQDRPVIDFLERVRAALPAA